MLNFKDETMYILEKNNKNEKDVVCVVYNEYQTSWDDFIQHCDFDYHDGFGSIEINPDIYIVGDDWWLERVEYDGAEEWDYKRKPIATMGYKKINQTNIKDNKHNWEE